MRLFEDEEWGTKTDRMIAEKARVYYKIVAKVRDPLGKSPKGGDEPETRMGKDGNQNHAKKIKKTIDGKVRNIIDAPVTPTERSSEDAKNVNKHDPDAVAGKPVERPDLKRCWPGR